MPRVDYPHVWDAEVEHRINQRLRNRFRFLRLVSAFLSGRSQGSAVCRKYTTPRSRSRRIIVVDVVLRTSETGAPTQPDFDLVSKSTLSFVIQGNRAAVKDQLELSSVLFASFLGRRASIGVDTAIIIFSLRETCFVAKSHGCWSPGNSGAWRRFQQCSNRLRHFNWRYSRAAILFLFARNGRDSTQHMEAY